MTDNSSSIYNQTVRRVGAAVKSTTGNRRMRVDGKMEQEWVKIQYDENRKEISRTPFWQAV